ncbi:MAG: hypothetical protein SFX73_30110 [Kofleriaceae bacterium]|nr:hypothetical protein [Kofleriaceae bacterium]
MDRVGRTGHGQLIGTPLTLSLLGSAGEGNLAVPIRKRFTLGTLRLELIPSGRGLGAAALHVDGAAMITGAAGRSARGGHTVLYAGAVRTTTGGAGDAAEVRSCDALVVGAPFGEPHHVFPPLTKVIDQACSWARAQLANDKRPVLLVDTALDGLEVALRLADAGLPVAAARPIREAAARAAGAVAFPPARGGAARARGDVDASRRWIASPGKEPRAVVWLDSDHAGVLKALSGKRFATALASGRALDSATGYDTAFPWAHAADRKQLLAWIESANARDVFVTGTCADSIAHVLGARARVIGPPRQMALFAT